MNFLGVGPGELVVIMVLALIVFGPQKLPEIGKSLGKAIAEFRRTTSTITEEFNRELQLDSILNPTLEPPKAAAQQPAASTGSTNAGVSPAATSVEYPSSESSSAATATEPGQMEEATAIDTVVPAPAEDLTAAHVPEEPTTIEPEPMATVETGGTAEESPKVEFEAAAVAEPAAAPQEATENGGEERSGDGFPTGTHA